MCKSCSRNHQIQPDATPRTKVDGTYCLGSDLGLNKLSACEYYKAPVSVDEFDANDKGQRFTKILAKASPSSYDLIETKRRMSEVKEWHDFFSYLGEDAYIVIASDEQSFCNANHDDHGDEMIYSCHRHDGQYHLSTHALSTINGYHVAKIFDSYDNMKGRFYFFYDYEHKAVYQFGAYLRDKDGYTTNGHQKKVNILLSAIIFGTLNTRAISDISVEISDAGMVDDTYYNENSCYKGYVLFTGDDVPPTDIYLETALDVANCPHTHVCYDCDRNLPDEDDRIYCHHDGETRCENCVFYCQGSQEYYSTDLESVYINGEIYGECYALSHVESNENYGYCFECCEWHYIDEMDVNQHTELECLGCIEKSGKSFCEGYGHYGEYEIVEIDGHEELLSGNYSTDYLEYKGIDYELFISA